MTDSSTIRWEKGDDDIVVLTLDDPTQSVNTMSAAYVTSMGATVERLEAEKDSIKGVVLTSAKSTFFAGGDLNEMLQVTPEWGAAFADHLRNMKGQLRRLETLGKPVVAAINGAALGGGLEICLAAHHRVIVDDPKAVVGLPEVTLGLLPGAGGVTRTVRMLGIVAALDKVLLRGQRHRPAQALELGLVDEIVATRDDLLPAAKKWIADNPEAVQPWDVKGHKIPGGRPQDPQMVQTLPVVIAQLGKQLKGANYPAPHAIQAAAVEGAQVDFDTACEIETRWFVDLVTGQTAKNMIQFFFDSQQLRRRSKGEGEPFKPQKAVVLGAGMMGAGIAYVCAKAGMEVVLKDVSTEAAERGKAYSAKLVAKAVERGQMTQEKADAFLARITPTTDPADAAGGDLLIEAVFEDAALKAQVMQEVEPHLAPDALLASNTSTLPITGLAQSVTRPADFAGLHFFSPVDKMPLVEIIKGEETSPETVQRSLDVVNALGMTPIVVNDSRGFFTSRVIMTFIFEGIAMLLEGIPAPSIEQASAQAGYPAPVLQLTDELNMKLIRRIWAETKAAVEADGGTWTPHAAQGVVDRMLDEFQRPGRLEGAGFYAYEDGRRVGLWSGLKDAFGGENRDVPLIDMIERMLFAEAVETVKCLDEGVLETVAEANVGSIIGIGFPAWTGGVMQYVNGYESREHPERRGVAGFVERARELAEQYGERFEPPASLVEKAERGERFTDEVAA